MIKTAVFIDFDHTLFHTDQFFHVDMRNAFVRRGIDAECWEQSYDAVLPRGFTVEKLVTEIYERSGHILPLGDMQTMIRESFIDLGRYVFPDVVPFLTRLRKEDTPAHLLSFGVSEWQRYKVFGSGIAEYFTDMFFTASEGTKAGVILAKVSDARKIIMVDNNPLELDIICDAVPSVQTYCINRVPKNMMASDDEPRRRLFLEARRYVGRPSRHEHIACRSLGEILL